MRTTGHERIAAREGGVVPEPPSLFPSAWATIRADWLAARVGFPGGSLSTKSKWGDKTTARHVAFYALRNWPNLGGAFASYPEIAAAFGLKGSHSTIIDACNQVEDSPTLIRRSMRLVSEGRIAMEREYRSAILRLVACGRT